MSCGFHVGATLSCVAIWQNGVKIISDNQGNIKTPSCVAFTEYEQLVGYPAKDQSVMNPINTIYDVKSMIGRRFSHPLIQQSMLNWPFKVAEINRYEPHIEVDYLNERRIFSPVQILAIILQKLKSIAEAHLGTTVNEAVLTAPATFNDAQRRVLIDSATIAGLTVRKVVSEPIAAVIAYGLKNTDAVKKILVFSLGGATLKVSLVAIEEGITEIVADAGDPFMGGENFDCRMANYFLQEMRQKEGVDISRNARAFYRLKNACEQAKCELSSQTEAYIEIRALSEGIDFSKQITRELFEHLNQDLFHQCMESVKKVLQDARIDKMAVDEVLLVGGSTRIPMLQQLLKEFFNGKTLLNHINPEEVIAYGAAMQAAMRV